MQTWVCGASFFGSDVPFWVLRRHVVVFFVKMRANRRCGAGAEEVGAFETASGFLRPGVLLYAVELKRSKISCSRLQSALYRRLGRFRACFLTRWPQFANSGKKWRLRRGWLARTARRLLTKGGVICQQRCGLAGRCYARRAQVATMRAMGRLVSSTISTV